MATKVDRWVSTDGREFDSEAKCRAYEDAAALRGFLESRLSSRETRDNVLDDVLAHFELLPRSADARAVAVRGWGNLPQVDRVLVISTGHVSEQTAKWLSAAPSAAPERPPVMYWEEGRCWRWIGWQVWVPDTREDDSSPAQYADLSAVLDFARDLGCRWVRFDCDADVLPELPKFNW